MERRLGHSNCKRNLTLFNIKIDFYFQINFFFYWGMIYDENLYKHILFINIFHGIQKIGKVKWYPFTYNGEITDYEASNTGLVRNKNTKSIFESTKPTLKRLKRLAEKGNNNLGVHYLRRVTLKKTSL